MRFGRWRVATIAITMTAALWANRTATAGDLFHNTIPTEVEAIDVNTGKPYYAPPIPYGHYAKPGLLSKGIGFPGLGLHGFGLGGAGMCGLCGGKGCSDCGGTGLFHGGLGKGMGCGLKGCNGLGCGGMGGHALRFKGCGLCGGKGCGVCTSSVLASSQVAPAPQAGHSHPSAQSAGGCGLKGCGLGHGHKHGLGMGMGMGGGGCGACGGRGCNSCGLGGLGMGGGGCGACGGRGCNLCGFGGLGGHGLPGLGKAKGMLYGILHPHAGKIDYFVGPGGPVPLTPGYVPYVNVTRSPRDFLAFPPFTP